MLTDNEIKKHPEDKLRFKTLSDALTRIVLYSETPITIGVFGEWGSGKSSLMRLTESELTSKEDAKVKTVWFNAWKFDKAHDLRVALIHAILKEIENDKSAVKSVKDKAVKLLKRINWLGLGRTAVNIGATIAAPYLAVIPLLSQVFSDSKKGTDTLTKLLPTELLKAQTEGKELELIGEFEDQFKKIASEYVGEDGRLVVFIDDLDRCLPEKALDILEAIKLFLNVPGTVFIIGTDVKVIENGLAGKYGDKSHSLAKNYLDKIIQVPFRIPPLSKEDIIEHFIPSLSIADDLKEYGFIIADAGNNPRTIKRLLNNIELQRVLSKDRDIVVEDIILVKLNVLEFKWKEFHSDMVELYARSNANLLKIMDEYEHANERKKETMLKDQPLLSNYISNYELMSFLNKEPSLDNIEVAPYIHLQKSTSSIGIEDERGGDINKYFTLGFSRFEEKDYIKAIDYYTRVINLNPLYKEAYYNRGLACYNLGHFKRAINDFNKSTEIDKEYSIGFYWMANAHHELKEFESAIINFTKAIDLNPGFPDGYFRRALSFMSANKLKESIEDNTAVINIDSKFTNAYINRGLSYHRLNRFNEAIIDYLKALNISPDSELAFNNALSLLNELIEDKKLVPATWDSAEIQKLYSECNITEDQRKNLDKLVLEIKKK